MNDLNGTALTALAAALAPYLVSELAKVQSGAGGNPTTQQGGGFGAQQNTGAVFPGTTNTPTSPQQPVQQAAANPFGAQPQQAAQQPTVTPDMIQTLITPLVQNEQIKNALMQQMQAMGIQNLPEAQPGQLAELYQRFQTVEQQAREAGLLGAPAGGGSPSLI